MTDDSHPTGVTTPVRSEIPRPEAVAGTDDADGYVVWHRKHLRVDDHRALADAVDAGAVVCPLFVFDPTFYGDDGLACDARLRFLHEALTSLDRLYAAREAAVIAAPRSREHLDGDGLDLSAHPGKKALAPPEAAGMTFGYGSPPALLARFVDRGWSVLTMATPTSRYGRRRDERVRDTCGTGVEFVSGDGLVRDRERSREGWQEHVESWLAEPQHEVARDDTRRVVLDTGLTPAAVDSAFGVTPTKQKVPTGTHRAATAQLHEFVDRIHAYPGNISAPQDARDGTSGLSPYLNFGLLSVRQVYQHVTETVPESRGREMFVSRLFWNRHYNQKLADWPGWTTEAVNPVLAGFNEETHDPALVEAWKQGQTGYPMVDASMRCLRSTGWLNFRMRAMCASFFARILRQPWWLGADWYHHHLIDSDVGINYTQWQSQAGLVGKPAQRVYNPRKQVRDHDPEGEWVTEWVPELQDLPAEFLPRPERTPLAVQRDCGVVVGEDYPRPVVEFETRREAYWQRFEQLRPAAAEALGRPEIARRASFSGGYGAARAIAEEYGPDGTGTARQVTLDALGSDGGDGTDSHPDGETPADTEPGVAPRGTDRQEGSPDDPGEDGVTRSPRTSTADDSAVTRDGEGEDGQTTLDWFDSPS